MNDANMPLVTVVISTRYREDSAAKTIQTILMNDYPHFEPKVLDQSEDDIIENSVGPFLLTPAFAI